jgi:hypothetical protein
MDVVAPLRNGTTETTRYENVARVLESDLPLSQPDPRNLATTIDLIVCAVSPKNNRTR